MARIVVDANGILAFANQRARLMFTLNPRDIGRPLQDLEISYRPAELRSLIEQAHAEHRTVTQASVERRFPNGEVHYLDVIVSPLTDEGGGLLGSGVVFIDVRDGLVTGSTTFLNVDELLPIFGSPNQTGDF